jgi:hypothetical protein
MRDECHLFFKLNDIKYHKIQNTKQKLTSKQSGEGNVIIIITCTQVNPLKTKETK